MSSKLFTLDNLSVLEKFIVPETLFAFDLDGTLAPIIEDFSAVKISGPVRSGLEKLVRFAKVAIISGRSRRDALNILGFEPQMVIGNHGAEWPSNRENRSWQHVNCCLKWRDRLHDLLFDADGVEIEFKGESLAIHYRKAADPERAVAEIDSAIVKLEPVPKKFGGIFVVNLVPMEASGKGEALIASMDHFGLKKAIYLGDDVTDEDVFLMRNPDIFGIHIGKDTQTAAPYYLNSQEDVLELLNALVVIMESRSE